MTILLSIIIPVYNTEPYLSKCLESICSQIDASEKRVDIWVVNDGSTDNSFKIINYYKNNKKFIHVINKENGGVSDARNAALDNAAGRYVWFVDSDDAVETFCLKKILFILEKAKADYIYFNAHRVDKNNNIIGSFLHECFPCEKKFSFSYQQVQQGFSKHMLWMRLFRRDFIGEQRFPKGITHEDIHFDILLLARCPTIFYLDDFFYRHFFDNPESITNTMDAKKFKHVLWVYEDLLKVFKQNHTFRHCLKEYKKIMVLRLVQRINFMLTTDLAIKYKKQIFTDYASVIYNINTAFKPVNNKFTDLNSCIELFLIRNKLFKSAYLYAILFLKIKDLFKI